MRSHVAVIPIAVVVLVVLPHAGKAGKTLFKRDPSETDKSNLDTVDHPELKGYSAHYRPVASEEEEEVAAGGTVAKSTIRLPKVNGQGAQNYDVASNKRDTDFIEPSADSGRLQHAKYKKRNSPYGIVYNQGKPIGILEPISRFYEFYDYKHEEKDDEKSPVNKREEQAVEDFGDDTSLKQQPAQLASDGSDKYASILTNFKIGSRLNMKQMDGEAAADDKQEKALKKKRSTKEVVKDQNLEQIENNLKDIMSDLGLINDEKINGKREIEDEDLDSGGNRIALTKDTHLERNKKENKESCPGKTVTNALSSKTLRKGADIANTEDTGLEGDPSPMSKANDKKKKKVTNYKAEGEGFIRKKRQQSKTENTDIVKGLETSGDLTVSGNKSPLASSVTASETENKRTTKEEKTEKREKPDEYDKRMQRNIQNKITEIKDEVKREINALKDSSQKTDKVAITGEVKTAEIKRDTKNVAIPSQKDDKKMKPEDKEKRDDKQNKKIRKKRNLLEKENEKLNPSINSKDATEPHIRKRRHTLEDDEDQNAGVTWEEVPEANINKREGKPSPEIHDPRSYEFHYRSKRDDTAASTSMDDDGNTIKKRVVSVDSKKNGLGFPDAPNQNVKVADSPVTRALVPRESETKNAPVAVEMKAKKQDLVGIGQINKDRLEKIISDSSNLKESLKPESKDHSNEGDVEVELHTNTNAKKREKSSETETTDDAPKDKRSIDEMKKGTKIEPSDDGVKDSSVAKITPESELELKLEDKAKSDLKGEAKFSELGDKAESKLIDPLLESKMSDVNLLENTDATVKKRSVVEALTSKSNAKITEEMNKIGPARNNRQERKSEPSLSLEEMQRLDDENNSKRKRRQADFYYYRNKREYQEPTNMQFKTYRGDEDEADDESDEFDDDNFDDRTSNLVRKRAANSNTNYDEFDEDYEPISVSRQDNKMINKRNAMSRPYAYDNSNYLYDSDAAAQRKKRQTFDDLVALHSGGPMINHLSAAKERNMQPIAKNYRRKRLEKLSQKQSKDQTIAGLSESDIFGGLPQSYEGELTRFKRVKRDNSDKDNTT